MRHTYGPMSNPFQVVADPTAAGDVPPASSPLPVANAPLLDVMTTIDGVDPMVEPTPVTVGIPAYPLAGYNLLTAVYGVALPLGTALPDSPGDLLTSAWPKARTAAPPGGGSQVIIPIPFVPRGVISVVQVINEYDN